MYGVNGAMSVLSSVRAVIVPMLYSFTPAFFTGLMFYSIIFELVRSLHFRSRNIHAMIYYRLLYHAGRNSSLLDSRTLIKRCTLMAAVFCGGRKAFEFYSISADTSGVMLRGWKHFESASQTMAGGLR